MNRGKTTGVVAAAVIVVGLALLSPAPAAAALKTPADKFVRTANYYLKAGTDIRPEHYDQLAKYDLLILPAEAQVYNRTLFGELRKRNPTILILAYVPTKSYNYSWVDPLHAKLQAGLQDAWWLHDQFGGQVSVWPGTAMLNMVSGWGDYLPQFVASEIWATKLWDGILYDEFSGNVSWVNGGNIDIHRDSGKDDPTLVDVAWKRATMNMLKATRDKLGAEAIIVTNGDSTDDLQANINGRMFESFPTPWEAGGTWAGVMSNYIRLQTRVGYPAVFIINANTGNTGENADFRKVRFSLASTMLGDGFFSFDFGETDHGQIWNYDEQGVKLGRPLGGPVNLLAPTKKNLTAGVWRRDFENGVVLVNSTDQPRKVELKEELERIRGAQAPDVNDGSVATSVTLAASDGLLLLKPLAKLIGATFPNGAYARVFDKNGAKVRNGFFTYVAPYDGMSSIVLRDIDGDGAIEKIVAEKNTVSVNSSDGTRRASFQPYGANYNLGINIAVGDLDGNGQLEIVTGTGAGAGPQVRIYNMNGAPQGSGFFAYDPKFRGGVQVAVGDLYGNGREMIVAGAGVGGGPHVRIFTGSGRAIHPGFFAYDPKFRGGVQVAVGDIDGNGRAEIITGAGPGGGPHVRIFNRDGRLLGPGFMAADAAGRGGVRVAAADINGDKIAEIVALSTDIFQFSLAR